MAMDWANERYVRVYTRDTPEWMSLSFPAQGLLVLMLRKVSRAGILELGRLGKRGVFIAIGHAHQAAMLEPALEELLEDGCVQINGDTLVIPNFLEAQETPASDAQRAREHRARVRDGVTRPKRNVTKPTTPTDPRDGSNTKRDAPNTERDQTSHGPVVAVEIVTPNCAVPSVPSEPAAARAAVDDFPRKPLEVVDESGPGPWDGADPFPLVARFRHALADSLARTTPHPVGGSGRDLDVLAACQRALVVLGEAEAVRLCSERVREAVKRRDPQPRTLKFFVDCVLNDELTRRASEPKRQGRVIGLDEKTGALIREEVTP
jgi:hypothetical protein